MRVVGTILVLIALAAVQVPWFSCHTDCKDAFLPVWELVVHHCHDEAAHAHQGHLCTERPQSHGHVHGPAHGHDHDHDHGHAAEDGASDGEGKAPHPDHEPGDHEQKLEASRRPAPTEDLTPARAPSTLLVVTLDVPRPDVCVVVPSPGVRDTGPPSRLASVRLLL